jgi:alpha,alpha-trehalase
MDLREQSQGGVFYREDLIRSTIDSCIPVDLNALLFKYSEDCLFINKYASTAGIILGADEAEYWEGEQDRLRGAFQQFWSDSRGYFCNLQLSSDNRPSYLGDFLHLAELVYPLWCGVATTQQAEKIVPKIEQLITPYGVHMSLLDTGCQWDFNMWPLQAILCFEALLRYGYQQQATQVAEGYCRCVELSFESSQTIFEKYNPKEGSTNTSGRYPAAEDFSWGAAAYLYLSRRR